VPLGFAKIVFNRKFMWLDWKTQPDESLGGTVYGLPHGKLLNVFIEAASRVLGIPRNNDFNRNNIEGTGYWDLATWNGRRTSTDVAYLRPARKKTNVAVTTGATVTRIHFDGRRATGVSYRKNGQEYRISARRDVVLAAGALHTPQLLQVSGVGRVLCCSATASVWSTTCPGWPRPDGPCAVRSQVQDHQPPHLQQEGRQLVHTGHGGG
jgi:choline dehydrogenase-like flavoprotein